MPPSHQPPNSRLRFQHMIYTSTKSRVVRQQTAFGVKIPEEVFDDEGEFKIPMWIWQKGDGGGDGLKLSKRKLTKRRRRKSTKDRIWRLRSRSWHRAWKK
ncbi:hypothetical protein WG66_003201 [Moniliophthora roreri]|nr:hypothetical protein WG66_003201 [Moniliophthora roreri]